MRETIRKKKVNGLIVRV